MTAAVGASGPSVSWRFVDTALLTLIVLVGALVRLIFFFNAPVFIHGDSQQYYEPALALLDGEGLALLLKRPPLYSAFIALVARLFGESLFDVIVVQTLLGLATAALAYGIGRLALGRLAGFVGGLAAALSGGLLIYEHYVLTETLFTFLLALAVWLFVVALWNDSVWFYIAAGCAIGLATLTRPHGQILLLICPIVAVIWHRRWRPSVRAIALTTLAAAVVILPWMARNMVVHGSFTIASGVGLNLVAKTAHFHNGKFVFFDAANPPQDVNPKRLEARRLLQELSEQENSRYPISGLRTQDWLMRKLDLTQPEADRIMRDVAMDAIRARPLTYAAGVADDFRMILAGRVEELDYHWDQSARTKLPRDDFARIGVRSPDREQSFPIAERILSIYQSPQLGPILPVLFLLGLVASAVVPGWRLALLPGLAAVGMHAVSAATVAFVPRFHYPADPLVHVVAVGGVLYLARLLASLVQRRRFSRATGPDSGHMDHALG